MDNINNLIKAALKEDIGNGDVTANATVPKNIIGIAKIVAKEKIVVCGTKIAEKVFKKVDKKLKVKIVKKDGQLINKGSVIAEIKGPARSLLTAERTALNFLQHLSGIATLTNKYVSALKGARTKILDTRKTTPGWRMLEKYAVKTGGGKNHRIGLFDMFLIKNNHIDVAGSITEAVMAARQSNKRKLNIEVEVRNFAELEEAITLGADIIMLDNFSAKITKKAVKFGRKMGLYFGKIPKFEASGGINLSTIRSFTKASVDFISIGSLTHSAPAVDIHMKIETNRP